MRARAANSIQVYYRPQPYGEPLDLSFPAGEIVRRTDAMCQARPDFATRQQRSASLKERLRANRITGSRIETSGF
jgi:hypothetical protein